LGFALGLHGRRADRSASRLLEGASGLTQHAAARRRGRRVGPIVVVAELGPAAPVVVAVADVAPVLLPAAGGLALPIPTQLRLGGLPVACRALPVVAVRLVAEA